MSRFVDLVILAQAGFTLGAAVVFLILFARTLIYHHVVAECIGIAILTLISAARVMEDDPEPSWRTWGRFIAFACIDYGIVAVFRAKWKLRVFKAEAV